MQTALSKSWTRVAVSISYNGNHYTYTHIYMCVYICMYVSLYICMRMYMCMLVCMRGYIRVYVCMYLYIYLCMYKAHKISFQTFFVWALLLIVHIWNSSPLRSNLLRLQCTCCTKNLFQQLLEGPMEVLLCERVNGLRRSLFHLLNFLITTASELRD